MDFDTGEWTIAGDVWMLDDTRSFVIRFLTWSFVFQFDGTTGTVTGLKPGKCYEFEIVAVNKEGESPAAKIDEPVFTLDISSKLLQFSLWNRHLWINILVAGDNFSTTTDQLHLAI